MRGELSSELELQLGMLKSNFFGTVGLLDVGLLQLCAAVAGVSDR